MFWRINGTLTHEQMLTLAHGSALFMARRLPRSICRATTRRRELRRAARFRRGEARASDRGCVMWEEKTITPVFSFVSSVSSAGNCTNTKEVLQIFPCAWLL
jgi:hypothetical protein